jgi:arsenate reductase (thioredoxin)
MEHGNIMSNPKNVAFVCLHGSAKSLIAAEYMNRMAQTRGLALTATTSGPEPDAEVPQNVIEGLLGRGIDARDRAPERVSAQALTRADHIVSFGCDLAGLVKPGQSIERWDDCPAVSDDFDIAWSFITGRVEQLMERFPESKPAT